jgi:hypothetical protein
MSLLIACKLALSLSLGDSGHIQIQGQAFERARDAQTIVRSILKERCEMDYSIQVSHCKNIIGNDPSSKVCYIATEAGYFFVMKDMLENVNVIFNRWD